MAKTRPVLPMQIAKIGYILISVLSCVMGIILLAQPEFSVVLLGRLLGGVMITFGIIKLVGYFSKDLYRLAFQYDLAFGILLIILGFIILTQTGAARLSSAVLGVAILADSLFKIQIALDARQFGLRRWWLILALSILSSITGFLLILQRDTGAMLFSVVLGLAVLLEGILRLCVPLSTAKIISYQQIDESEE